MEPRPDSSQARQEPGPSAPGETRKRYWTAAALGLLALLLFVQQYTTMVRLAVFPPGSRARSFSEFLAVTFKGVEFGALDYALLASIAGLFLTLLIAEFRGGCLSSLLRAVSTSECGTVALLAAGGFVAVRAYIGLGEFSWGADQPQHISFAHMASRSISEGELPIWTNYLGAGTPYLQFYGFLFFYLTGLVDQLWNDIFASLKAVMAVLHAASGVAMYLLARTLTGSRRAGFIAGMAYVLSFWHYQQVSIMGRFPLSLFYALLPLPFYFFERLSSPGSGANRERLASALAGGICLGALALTHPGYGFWATLLLAVYVGLRLLAIPGCGRRGLAAWSAVLFAGGLVFGGYLTLPMWVERGHTGLHSSLVDLSSVPVPTWRHVLSWSNYRFWALPPSDINVNWYGGYVGLSLATVAAAGAVAALRSGSRVLVLRSLPALCCLGVTVVLVFGYRWEPFQSLPVVKMLSAGRYLLFTVFFLALVVGPASQSLMILLRRRRWRIPVSTVILVTVAVDLVPTTFQQAYWKLPSGIETEMDMFGQTLDLYKPLRARADSLYLHGQLPGHRVFWASPEHGYSVKGQLYFHSRTPIPESFHPGQVRAAADFVSPFAEYFTAVLGGMLSGKTENGSPIPGSVFGTGHHEVVRSALSMLDVKYLMASDSNGQTALSDLGTEGPVLVSATILPFPAEQLDQLVASGEPADFMETRGLDASFSRALAEAHHTLFLVANTRVNPQTRVCERIFVLDAGSRELGTNPAVEVLEHTVRMQRVDLKLRVSEACFARLAYSWFPHLRLTVDGREADPLRTAGGFMAVHLEAGEHRLTLEAELSPLRRVLLAVNLLYMAATVFLFVEVWRRKR